MLHEFVFKEILLFVFLLIWVLGAVGYLVIRLCWPTNPEADYLSDDSDGDSDGDD